MVSFDLAGSVALVEQADAVLARTAGLEQAMAELSGGESGHLRVGSIEPTASQRLPGTLARYCRDHPRVRLTVEVGGAETIASGVASGELDVGVCSPPHAHEDVSFEPLFVEAMALLVPEGHPLAEVDAVGANELAKHNLMLSERSCAYRQEIERVLLKLGSARFPR